MPEPTWSEIAAGMQGLIERCDRIADKFQAWSTGAANGGPNGDGRYPLEGAGGDVLVPCPAKIEAGGFDKECLVLACFSDLSVVSQGTSVARMRAPWPMSVTGVRASLAVGSMAGNLTIDVKVNGASILSTRITILAGQITSRAAGTTQPVVSAAAIPDDAEITIDVIAEGMGARGLKVSLIANTTG